MDAEKDEKAVDETKLKQAKNLFNSLIKDESSIFYSVNKINKNLSLRLEDRFMQRTKYLLNCILK